MKRKLFLITTIGFLIISVIVILTFSMIDNQVEKVVDQATNKYKAETIDALILMVKSENETFRDRNRAIWALGQIADKEALTFLIHLNETLPDAHRSSLTTEISKYEVEKAIKWCEKGNLTSWMHD